MKENSNGFPNGFPNGFEPLALMQTLLSAMSDAMNLRHLREELYGEAAHLPPLRVDDVQLPAPTQRFDQPPAQIEPMRVERLRSDIG